MQQTANKMTVAHREMCVAASGIPPAIPVALAGLASTFARAILGRYMSHQAGGLLPALVLKRIQPGVALSRVYHRAEVHLAPRLDLTLRLEQHADQLEEWGTPQVLTQRFSRPAEPTRTEQLVHRLSRRGERLEAVATPLSRPGKSGPATIALAAQPVPMVVRRPAPVLPVQEAEPAAPSARRSVPAGRPQVMDHGQQAVAFEPPDVNRLTDQVVQAIDRRLNAYRERLGR